CRKTGEQLAHGPPVVLNRGGAMTVPIHESICITPLATIVSLDSLMTSDRDHDMGFDVPDEIESLDDLQDARRAFSAVHSFLNGLPERKRDLLVRIFWNNEPQALIAREMGISGAAVSKSLAKILKIGRRKLAPYRNIPLDSVQML